MKIRIAHVVNSQFGYEFSGITHRLFSLLSGWNDKDIVLDLFASKIKPLNINSGEHVYRLEAGSLWSSPKRLDRWGRIRWSIALLIMLVKRRNEYDIVHFHSLNWGVFISPIILHCLKKKIVFTMSLYGNDNPGHFGKKVRGKLQVLLMRQFDGVIGISQALVADAISNGMLNVIKLPNFLAITELEEPIIDSRIPEMRSLARTKIGLPEDAKILLFIGSVIRRKGVDIVVDAYIELANKYPLLRLVLVGPQSQAESTAIDMEYVVQLKEKLDIAGLNHRVLWVGMITDQSILVDYYRSADIFVFPTRNEGLGNVLIEAAAAGLPVVASLLPGITDEVVSDGDSGYLVSVDDTNQFCFAIDQLLQDDSKRYTMGATGRRIALEKFGFDAYCQKLKQFYLDLYQEENHA